MGGEDRLFACTVIRFLCASDKFDTCTVVSVNGTLVEDKIRRFKGECAHFIFNKRTISTHDGASAKFTTNSHETDYSVSCIVTVKVGHGQCLSFLPGTLLIYQFP
jgi:hypothetical protein